MPKRYSMSSDDYKNGSIPAQDGATIESSSVQLKHITDNNLTEGNK